jgi:hypothetical protein
MQEVKLSSDMVLTLYGSIKELPIGLSKKFGAYLLQDAGIGSSMEDVDDHLGRLMKYLSLNRTQDALEEAKNLRYNIFSMLVGTDYRSMSLLCLVAKVNGEPWDDYSPEGLNSLLDKIKQYPVGTLEKVLEEVKKNLIPNANYIFQNTSGMTSTISKKSGNT